MSYHSYEENNANAIKCLLGILVKIIFGVIICFIFMSYLTNNFILITKNISVIANCREGRYSENFV